MRFESVKDLGKQKTQGRTVQPSLVKLTAELTGSVSVDKGYESDVFVKVCLRQQSGFHHPENEGSNPSAPVYW